MPTDRIPSFLETSHMKRGGSSLTYLEIPLFSGALKRSWLLLWADKIKHKLSLWKGFSLSFAGRLCLINYVIMGQMVYSFQVYRWPTSILTDLTSTICNFLWSRSINVRKPVTVSWKSCCKPKIDGGLGLRGLKKLNETLLKKITWSLITEDSYVFQFLRS